MLNFNFLRSGGEAHANEEQLTIKIDDPNTATTVSSTGEFQRSPRGRAKAFSQPINSSITNGSDSGDETCPDSPATSIIHGSVFGNNKFDMIQNAGNIQLLPGEDELARDNIVNEWNGHQWIQGAFILTNYRFIFQPTNVSTYDDIPNYDGCQVPLTMINRIDKIGGKTSKQDHGYLIEIQTKDFRFLRFSFIISRGTRGKFFKAMKEEVKNFFCFSYSLPVKKGMIDGWKIYDPLKEFVRQGAVSNTSNPYQQTHDQHHTSWRMSKVNGDYKMCDTYPQEICVPSNLSDEDLKLVAAYRSKGRLPILTYYEKNTGAALARSSQPLMGINLVSTNKKMKDDYKMIEAILQANKKCDRLMIIDLRPKLNAEANRAFKGAGYEKNYRNCELKFLNIENIHVMRSSLNKLVQHCTSTGGLDSRWASGVETTAWLEHIRCILVASKLCVECLEKDKMSILLHCSDGWDRTSQVACAVQMMLDPYFRTFEGFAVLIEKDWSSFGHKFQTRTGHGSRQYLNEERAPIFLQYIEAVYQLLRQHPTAFEFNEQFLIFVLDQFHSCRFGTFLCDSDKERKEQGIPQKTPSIWTFALNPPNLEQFKNPFYCAERTNYTIIPDLRNSSIHLWTGYWLRYCKDSQGFCREFHFKKPEMLLLERANDLIAEIHRIEEAKTRAETKIEATVATFQRELKLMYQEIESLKQKNNEWKQRYETDTAQLLDLCEKQREELKKWSNGEYEANSIDSLTNKHPSTQNLLCSQDTINSTIETPSDDEQSQNELMDSYASSNNEVKSDDVTLLKQEGEKWKQLATDIQMEPPNNSEQPPEQCKPPSLSNIHSTFNPHKNSPTKIKKEELSREIRRSSSDDQWGHVSKTWQTIVSDNAKNQL